jgi:hypothetical protein
MAAAMCNVDAAIVWLTDNALSGSAIHSCRSASFRIWVNANIISRVRFLDVPLRSPDALNYGTLSTSRFRSLARTLAFGILEPSLANPILVDNSLKAAI